VSGQVDAVLYTIEEQCRPGVVATESEAFGLGSLIWQGKLPVWLKSYNPIGIKWGQ